MVDRRYQIFRGNHRHAIRKRRLVESALSCGGSRNPSVGLVGVAKQDAERGMKVVNEYLATKEGLSAGEMEEKIEGLVDMLQKKSAIVVTKEDVELLEARARKTWDFKYTSDEKMLEVIAARKSAR